MKKSDRNNKLNLYISIVTDLR